MTSYSNYQYSFRFSYQDILLVAGILTLFTIGSQVKNKQHLRSRHLVSYLVYSTDTQCEYSRAIGISETNHNIVGLEGETIKKT
jgi:hypothetical protein